MSDAPTSERHIFATDDGASSSQTRSPIPSIVTSQEKEEGVQAIMSDAPTSERDLFATDDSPIPSIITDQKEEGAETTQSGDFDHSQNPPKDVGGGSSQKPSEHVGSEVSFGSSQNPFKSPPATQKSANKKEPTEQPKGQKRKAAK
ncbi:hypothetical protein EMPG_12305, partial [Blastomyces silverae]